METSASEIVLKYLERGPLRPEDLGPELRAAAQDLYLQGKVEWLPLTKSIRLPEKPEPAVSLRDQAVWLFGNGGGAGVAELVKFIWGSQWKPNYPLYGKFAGLFKDKRQLVTLLLSKAAEVFERDPISELLPLAVAIGGAETVAERRAREEDARVNAESARNLRMYRWERLTNEQVDRLSPSEQAIRLKDLGIE